MTETQEQEERLPPLLQRAEDEGRGTHTPNPDASVQPGMRENAESQWE